MNDDVVHVVVAVIIDDDNQVLVSKRPDNVHLAGYWEFPGGKVEANESVEEALSRELNEELDIKITRSRPLIKIIHHYKEKSVFLDVWYILDYSGVVKGNEGQEISWRRKFELNGIDFPEANLPVIQAINLPDRCLITGSFSNSDEFMSCLESSINRDITLIQCRFTQDDVQLHGRDELKKTFLNARLLCEKRNVILMLNCTDKLDFGIISHRHLKSQHLLLQEKRPSECQLLSASCHDEAELLKAVELGVDFIFLSPVHVTGSHPDAKPLGWEQFSEMINGINVPVYALGGMSDSNLSDAWAAGAQGVAAINAFWKS